MDVVFVLNYARHVAEANVSIPPFSTATGAVADTWTEYSLSDATRLDSRSLLRTFEWVSSGFCQYWLKVESHMFLGADSSPLHKICDT